MRFCHCHHDFSGIISGNFSFFTAAGLVATRPFLSILWLALVPERHFSLLFLAEFSKLLGSMVTEIDTSLALKYKSTGTSATSGSGIYP
jgi:hypothetical protein